MRKVFAIGTLLLSSAAILVSPAAAAGDRNNYVNNQNYSRSYSAPAPAPAPGYSSYTDGGRFERRAQARIERRLRQERLERERRERARREWLYFHSFRRGY